MACNLKVEFTSHNKHVLGLNPKRWWTFSSSFYPFPLSFNSGVSLRGPSRRCISTLCCESSKMDASLAARDEKGATNSTDHGRKVPNGPLR